MSDIDLAAIIAAEAVREPRPVINGEQRWLVLPLLPWWFTRDSAEDPEAALKRLVVEGDPAKFAAAMLAGDPDWVVLYTRVRGIYGTGESGASPASSTNGTKRSRPTSSGSTASS